MMFSSRSLKTKLLILCLWLSAASAAVGICGYVGLNQVVHHYGLVADDSLPKIRLSDDMNLNYRQVRVSLRTLGLPGLTAHDAESAIRTVKESIAKYEESAELYRKMSFHGDEKTRFDKVQSSWTAFKAIGARALELYATGKPEDRAAMVRIFFVECPAAANEYAQAINSLVEFHRENAKIWVDDAHVESDRAVAFMVLAVILGFCFSMGFGFVIANGISNRLKLVSEGIAEGADRVAKAVQQIAEASQELLEGSTQQASALQQTAASVDQTSSMVSKNAENAQRSSDVSTTSQRSAEKGKEAVGQMIRSIEEIAASNDEIMQRIEQGNREISAIVKVISEIGEKTKVINDIVFQTKLLSFNASVEAARAGDMGKGFAVVAEEVGNLAEMSGRASREISGMLEESTKTVEGIVKGLQDRVAELSRVGGEKVKNGATMAKRCGDALDEIVSNVGLVGSLVTEISVASREQAQGVREITDAMGQIDRTAQQNNLASRESSETAEELRSEVGNLRRLVSDLDQTVRGVRAA